MPLVFMCVDRAACGFVSCIESVLVWGAFKVIECFIWLHRFSVQALDM